MTKDIHAWNTKMLKSRSIKGYAQPAYKVSRNVGDLQRATLWDGITVVERRQYIYIEQYGLVSCINTELHFVFETPSSMRGWGLYCTCGSLAGVVGWEAYSKLASPIGNGMIVACIHLLTTKNNTGIGEHADGSHE